MGAVNTYAPFNLFGGSASDATLPFNLQDTVNYVPEVADAADARSGGILRGVPGLTLLGTCGADPVRGIHNVEGQAFVVAGQQLYSVANNGTTTALGTITGVGRVSMAHNQRSNGYQVVIAAGADGFVYDTYAHHARAAGRTLLVQLGFRRRHEIHLDQRVRGRSAARSDCQPDHEPRRSVDVRRAHDADIRGHGADGCDLRTAARHPD